MVPPNSFRRGRNGGSQIGSFKLSSSSVRRRKARGNYKYKLREEAGALFSRDSLTSAFLNIDGLSDAKYVDVTNFVNEVSPDIFFLLESKRRAEDVGSDIAINGYDHTEIKRSDAAGDKPGGGIVYYTKNTGGVLFNKHSPSISHQGLEYVQNERVWVTVQSQNCKTAFCSVYLGCQYSDDNKHKEWNDGIYWVLRLEAVALRSAGYRLQFLGDFNGHIGNVVGQGVPGNSPDINPNGKRFLDFLLACDLRHVNGELRDMGDPESRICKGLWTRQRGNSKSIIDFVGVSAEHIDSVMSMNVDDSGSYGGGSDHNWSWVKMKDKFRILVPVKRSPKKKKVWNIDDSQDWTNFKDEIVKQFLPAVDGAGNLGLDDLAALVVNGFQEAGEKSLGYRQKTRRSSMKSRSLPRHVVSQLELKAQMEKQWKTLSSSSDVNGDAVTAAESAFKEQSFIVDEIFKSRALIKRNKTIKKNSGNSPSAKKNFWRNVTGKVKQSSEISAVLSSAGVVKCGQEDIREEVEKHLCNVFQGSMESQANPSQSDSPPGDHSYASPLDPPDPQHEHNYSESHKPRLNNVGTSEDLDKNPKNWLSRDFTSKELKKIAATLNNGKAQGWDGIPPEFIKNSPDVAFDLLTLLFNKIKASGKFPRGWNCGVITLIHKKGSRASLGNYRPITVLISLSAFYSKVLNERLIEVVETNNLLGEIQSGFRKGRCGADNIFVLSTLLWKARAMNEKVHLGFVDVAKAYDSINRKILWRILESLGFGGAFLQSLKAMYDDDSVKCGVNGSLTNSVYLQRGLRQGCSLSPLLFALYVMGLGEDLAAAKEGFVIGGTLISSLMFADDILLLAKTAEGLKRLYRIVKAHCDKLLLEINTGEGKSEVISPDDETWDLLDDDGDVELSLRQVLQYKYLGLETHSSIFRICVAKQAKCIKVANKYKFACLHLGRRDADVVDATLATWNNIAIPSILFGCESIIFKETNIAAIEAIQSSVAKSILGVGVNTVGICAQTELGMFPFRTLLYKSQLKFYFRVLSLPDSRWVKKALLDHLSLTWPSQYLANIVAIRNKVRLAFVPPNTRYFDVHMAQWSLSETNQILSQKSLPYVKQLLYYRRQPYVFEHSQLDTVAQFRLSNAGLGNRFPRFPVEGYRRRTTCPLCSCQSLSEAHVVFFCPAVERFREELDLKFFRNICKKKGFSEEKTFSLYVNGHDWNENLLPDPDFPSRGLAMDLLRGHWLSRW